MRKNPLFVSAMIALLFAHASTGFALVCSFRGLGDLSGGDFYSKANGISADGSTVVGRGTGTSGPEAFRWTASCGLQGLGSLYNLYSTAYDVSRDGAVVVGSSSSASGLSEAFRWEDLNRNGIVDNDEKLNNHPEFGLGGFPGGRFYSEGWCVSADGWVVAGYSNPAFGTEAFRWVDLNRNGIVDNDEKLDNCPEFGLGDFPGGSFDSSVYGALADGSVVVGHGNSTLGYEAFRWEDLNHNGKVDEDEKLDYHPEFGLGDLPGGNFYSSAWDISEDGLVVVGRSSSASGMEAFRWTASGGMQGLGDLPGGLFESDAYDVSADGSVVVGYSESLLGNEAFIWDTEHGMRSLRDVLVKDCGLDMTGWTLSNAMGISADGMIIVGYGTNPDGYTEAWMATVPEPATVLLLSFGGLLLLKKRRAE
jgi:probable HAF family extracellular repeat protein